MKSELNNLSEFKKILTNYKLSNSAKIQLDKSDLILLSAPTSAGRNTIIRELVKGGEYHFIISDTTRQPRVNDGVPEEDGINYWFRTETEMLQGLQAGNYLEAAIIHNQQVSGISINELKKAFEARAIAIADVDVQGVEAIMKLKPNTLAIFVLPPSIDVWMQRLKHRGVMSREELIRRLNSAINEFKFALNSDDFIFLINDDFHITTQEIRQLMLDRKADIELQEVGINLTKKLIKDTAELIKILS